MNNSKLISVLSKIESKLQFISDSKDTLCIPKAYKEMIKSSDDELKSLIDMLINNKSDQLVDNDIDTVIDTVLNNNKSDKQLLKG